MIREIIAYKDYYRDFMAKLSDKEQFKIRRALLLFSDTERIPTHFIKYIEEDISILKRIFMNSELIMETMNSESSSFMTVINW